jgi:lysophospholipase L1-like esterase
MEGGFGVKKIWKVVVVNIILVLLVLYGFEFYLYRSLPKLPCDDYSGSYKRCNVNKEKEKILYTWGNPVVNNSFGFREREFAIPKPDNVFRIMVLGDSLTWGAGLAVEERYTNRLEKYLNERLKGKFPKRIEVLNFGIPGGPTIAERDILRTFIDLVNPDLVIVGFCLNDPQPKSQEWSIEKDRIHRYARFFLSPIRRLFRILRLELTASFIENGFYKTLEKLGIIPPWYVALDRVYDKNSKEWKDFEEALKDIRDMSNKKGLPPPIFAVLNQGVYTDKPTDYRNPDDMLKLYLKWYHQAEDTASKIGFKTVNFEKEIAEKLHDKPLAVNVLDGHPSAEVNDIYAQKLAEFIIKEYFFKGGTYNGNKGRN